MKVWSVVIAAKDQSLCFKKKKNNWKLHLQLQIFMIILQGSAVPYRSIHSKYINTDYCYTSEPTEFVS